MKKKKKKKRGKKKTHEQQYCKKFDMTLFLKDLKNVKSYY